MVFFHLARNFALHLDSFDHSLVLFCLAQQLFTIEFSSKKQPRKALYDKKQVLDLLLEDSSDDDLHSETSENEFTGSESSDSNSESRSRSRLGSSQTTPDRSSVGKQPPSKKQKQTAQGQSTNSNISTLPQSRSGKGKGKGKASRPRSQPSPQAAQSLDTQTDRHLLDAENDDSVDTIDIELVTTEWQKSWP